MYPSMSYIRCSGVKSHKIKLHLKNKSVGIVCMRTQAMEFSFSLVSLQILEVTSRSLNRMQNCVVIIPNAHSALFLALTSLLKYSVTVLG
jgi:hypothetical protein